jgi:hypothetical protein
MRRRKIRPRIGFTSVAANLPRTYDRGSADARPGSPGPGRVPAAPDAASTTAEEAVR